LRVRAGQCQRCQGEGQEQFFHPNAVDK
jgi:hypothetical protein